MDQKIETFELGLGAVPLKQKTEVTGKDPVQTLVEEVD